MQEKTGRVELGKTCDEEGKPAVRVSNEGEPESDSTKTASIKNLKPPISTEQA